MGKLHNFKIALRFALKTKLFTVMNILGLCLGFLGFILAHLYINQENSYDAWNPNYENIYLVGINNQGETSALSPIGFGAYLKAEMPEIVEMGRMNYFPYEVPFVSEEGIHFIKNWVGADVSIAKIFDIQTLGMPLDSVNSSAVFIRHDIAAKLFPKNADVQQEWIMLANKENGLPLQLSGTVKERPGLSTIEIETIGFLKDLGSDLPEDQNVQTFIQVKSGTDIEALTVKMNELFERVSPKGNDNTAANGAITVYLDPLKNLHLRPKHGSSIGYKITISLGILSAVILVLAALNFANLMVVQAQNRSKEISMKKVFGVSQKSLAIQFFTEVFLQCVLAAMLALILVNLIVNVLVNSYGYALVAFHFEKDILWQLALSVLLTALVSGVYPAIILARKKPISLIQGSFQSNPAHPRFRQALLVFQFTIALGFTSVMMVIHGQMNFMAKGDRGFSTDQVVYIKNLALFENPNDFSSIRNRMKELPGIEKVTVATSLPGGHAPQAEEWIVRDKAYRMDFVGIDFEYFEILGMRLSQGRLFSNEFPADSSHSVILNETAARAFGMEGIGGRIKGFDRMYEVVGIVKDSKIQGFEALVQPTIYSIHNPTRVPKVHVLVKMDKANLADNIALLSKEWKSINKKDGDYFIYEFLDQKYASLFEKLNQLKSTFTNFTILIVLVALMGLFSMAAFSIQNRQKEIGIRKIIGASKREILLQLNKPFLIAICIAIFVSMPIAWYLSIRWLQTFAYRIELQGGYFVLASVFSMLIVFVIVSLQAIKVSYQNPVKALHEE